MWDKGEGRGPARVGAAAGAQRLRVTFDRLRLAAPKAGEHRLAATNCGRAVGGPPTSITRAEGERDEKGKTTD